MKKTLYIYFVAKHKPQMFITEGIMQSSFSIKQEKYKEILERANGNRNEAHKYLSNIIFGAFGHYKELEEEVKEYYRRGDEDETEVYSLDIVVADNQETVDGIYYAHEYDKHVPGRRTTTTYSNGHIEYIVECLDKSLKVIDGVWDDENGNGFGDYFE